MKWNDRTTYLFVKEYLKHECLFNNKSQNFRNKAAREAAISELCEVMNISEFGPKEALAKIKSIRSTYSQQLKKISESNDIYVPILKWFSIYHDVMCSKNLAAKERDSNWNDVEFTVEGLCSEDEYSNEEAAGSSRQTLLEPAADTLDTSAASRPIYSRKRNSKCMDNSMNKVAVTGEMGHTPSSNEFDMFGKSVAAQLRAMPLVMALQAQAHIQSYLSSFRVRALDGNILECHPSPPAHTTYISLPTPAGVSSVAVVPSPIVIKKDKASETDYDSDE